MEIYLEPWLDGVNCRLVTCTRIFPYKHTLPYGNVYYYVFVCGYIVLHQFCYCLFFVGEARGPKL